MKLTIRRGLAAAAVLAGVSTPAGVLVSQAGAQGTSGPEVVNATLYEVGTPDGNVGGGPFTAGGTVPGKGNTADLPSNTHILAFGPRGTVTVQDGGGKFTVAFLNPVNCHFVGNVSNLTSVVVSGTGTFAAATGTFRTSVSLSGTSGRDATTGACSLTVPPVQETSKVQAVGHIHLQ